jgi:hypothetical protein
MDRHIKQVLSHYLNEGKLSSGFTAEKIKKIWESKMGKSVQNQTKHVTFKDGELKIKIESSVLRYEMLQNSTQIIAMINSELGSDVVQKVAFT